MRRKKALIVYYTQTGQLRRIIDSVCKSLQQEFDFTYEELKPNPAFPFPWPGMSFYQVLPESVQETPCKLEAFSFDPEDDFDLVILAYQPWYLSPSIPFTAFLQTEEAVKVLKGKPVITILGSRNMWIMAQERVKKRIFDMGANLIGNIVLTDRRHNLVSVITIAHWMLKGEKHGGGLYGRLFPPAGILEKDISEAERFGFLIRDAFKDNALEGLQDALLSQGSIRINPVLMTTEKRGFMMFRAWSKFVLKKGSAGDPGRERRLKMFRIYLFAVIYLVSPIGGLVVWIIHKLNYRKTRKMIQYYSHNEYALSD
ncbi:MAG: dialkylresorcinol condensing enzyme DarA [Bacteroidetes bacterium]|nr:dialkylresorcinol condensing enzyme DarA [Bacteroidota bacterium]